MSLFNEMHVDHTMGGSMSCMNHRFGLVMLGFAVLAAPATLLAQEYPVKPIRWIIPYPTGRTSDFLARIIGQKLTEGWKQPILVGNRSGAKGTIATDAGGTA